MNAPLPVQEVLQRSSLFRFLPEELQAELQAKLVREQHAFGETIIRQGEETDAFYIVLSGRVRVVRELPDGGETVLGTLRPGDEFGEQAILGSGIRNATVRCSTSTETLRLRRSDFMELAERWPEIRTAVETTMKFRTLHGFLYEFSNFGRLPAKAIQELVEKLNPVEHSAGARIVREGDPAGPMFIVESGRLRAFTSSNGTSRNLAFYRTGDFFGELSLLDGSARAASVEAISDVRLLALEPEAVRELEEQHPEFRKLLEERRAQYQDQARVPRDFAEAVPAEASVADKTLGAATDDAEAPPRSRRKPRRRVPHIQQIDEMDCGAACLGMVCRAHGRKVSLPHLRQLCHTSRDGTSLRAICHAAAEVGLAARPLKVSPRNLPDLPLPAIVHWEGNHWVVLCSVGSRKVWIDDPALGPRTLPLADFLSRWTGYTALFDYTEALEQAPVSAPVFARFLPFFRQHAVTLVQVLLLAVVTTILHLLFPLFSQIVVDRVIVEHDVELLGGIVLAMAAAIIFSQGTILLQEYLVSFAAVRLDASLLDFLTRSLLALPMSYFHAKRTGDIQRRLDGARQVRQFFVQYGIGGLLALVTLAGAVLLMAVYSRMLAVVFLATTPLYLLLMWWSAKVLRPLFSDLEESQGRYASQQIDAIKGIEAVKAASAESGFRNTILNEFLSVSRKLFRSHFILMSYDGVLQTISLLSTALFLWVGATQVMAGQLTVGAFVAFASLAGIAHASILRTLGIWDQWQHVSVLLQRLNDIFESEPEQGRDRSLLLPVPTLEGRISLRDVSFRYGGPEAPEILTGITLDVPPGKLFAIVGRSGGGKSTLVKLIAGLIEPTHGKILLDHHDLSRLNYHDVRRHIGLVLQENHIFSGSVIHNIAFGDPEPDFDRVLHAAQAANAHAFILGLPQAYETQIGESGLALSGGQRQRIAIARALYGDPAILIFDEATSSLDTESERAIQANLASMTRGRTTLVIAHRLSTIRDADCILVLERGRIVESGTHDDLMARRGLYFHLSSQQLSL